MSETFNRVRPAAGDTSSSHRLTVFLLLGTGFMLSVDFSILNVAMPEIGAAVGLQVSQFAWILTAYALPCAGFTLLFGRVADLFGRRRLFLIGIATLAVASIGGGFASNPWLLLIARTFQGLATAIATPAALALLITSFKDENERARALGLNGALLSGGFTVGNLVGGFLVAAFSWRAAFLINVPVALLILTATPFLIPPSKNQKGVKLDVPGAVTVTLGLLTFCFGVINGNAIAIVGGIGLLSLFWIIELRVKAPLAAVSILSKPTVLWGNVATLIIFAMESALIFLMTLYLQRVLHFSPLQTGLTFGPPGLGSVAAGLFGGRFIARFGARNVLAVGMLVQAILTAPLAFLGPRLDMTWMVVLILALLLGFFGHVSAIVSCMTTATSGIGDTEQGLATGLASMAQQVGTTIGIPILSAVASTQMSLLAGIHLALFVDVAVTVTVAVVVWGGLRAIREKRVLPSFAIPRLGPLASQYQWLSAYERLWSDRLDILEQILRDSDAADSAVQSAS